MYFNQQSRSTLQKKTVPRSTSCGFTMVELLIAVAIFFVLISLAIPSFRSLTAKNRLKTACNELVSTLQTARTEAIRRGIRVTVCKGAPSSNSCDNNGAWVSGWIVFVDATPGSSPGIEDASDIILRGGGNYSSDLVIVGNGGSNGPATYVSYTPDGFPKQLGGGFYAGTLRVCSKSNALSNNERAFDLVINAVGRVNITAATGVSSSCPAP